MDNVCFWLGSVCGGDIYPGKMRNSTHGFQCGYSHQNHCSSYLFMDYGIPDGCADRTDGGGSKNVGVPDFVGSCHRCLLALLFPRAAAGRYQQGGTNR